MKRSLRIAAIVLVITVVALPVVVHAAETGGIGLDPGGIFDGIIDALKGLPDAIIGGITEWFRKKLIEYDREASTPFLYALPMLLKYTPDLNSGVVQVVQESFVSIGLGVASLLFGIGWLQVAGGQWIGSPLTAKQLVGRFCLAVIAVKGSGAFLIWVLKANDLIIQKLALDFNDQIFAPALDKDPINIIMLALGVVFRFVSIWGIWGLLVYRVVDLSLLWAMAPLPAAFSVLPSTSGLVRTFLTEFFAVTTQTLLFSVLLVFWTANTLRGADGLPLTWFQNTAATALLWGYLRKKPEWLRGLLHSAAFNYAGAVALAGQQALSGL